MRSYNYVSSLTSHFTASWIALPVRLFSTTLVTLSEQRQA